MKTMSALKTTATIGAAIVLALLSVQGTLALWNATATSKNQTALSADFKVTAAVGDKGPQQVPADGDLTVPGPSDLMPGKSKVTSIVVTNATDAGGSFTVKVSATATTTGPLAPYLVTSIGVGQDGECAQIRQSTSMVLDKGGHGTFCLATTLRADTPATFGGAGASIGVTLATAQQPR